MKHYRKLFFTIGVTGFAFVMNYIITLFLTPYITDTVGTEAYGFVSLAKNIAQYATFITLALNAFATRYISVAYYKKDYNQANVYFSSTFYGNILIGSSVFAVSLIAIWNLERIFQIPEGIVSDVKWLFVFVFIKFLFTTIVGTFSTATYIKDKLYINGIFKLFSYIAEATFLILFFVSFRPHVYFVGIAILIASIVESGIDFYICKKYTPELHAQRKQFSLRAIGDLAGKGIWSSFNSIGSILNSGLDLAVCNIMLNPLAMGQLAIAENIGLICKSIYRLTTRPFYPTFLKKYAANNKKEMYKSFFFSMKVSSFLSNLLFAGFTSLGMVYYRLWIPHQDIQIIYRITVISIITSLSSGAIYPLLYIDTLKLKNKIPSLFTIGSGIMNVISMYFLIKYTNLGCYAVVGTTAVLITFVNLVLHPLYIAYIMEEKWYFFYPEIFKCIGSGITMTVVFCCLSKYLIHPSTWIGLIAAALFYSVIGFGIQLIVALNKEEKSKVKNLIAQKLA